MTCARAKNYYLIKGDDFYEIKKNYCISDILYNGIK